MSINQVGIEPTQPFWIPTSSQFGFAMLPLHHWLRYANRVLPPDKSFGRALCYCYIIGAVFCCYLMSSTLLYFGFNKCQWLGVRNSNPQSLPPKGSAMTRLRQHLIYSCSTGRIRTYIISINSRMHCHYATVDLCELYLLFFLALSRFSLPNQLGAIQHPMMKREFESRKVFWIRLPFSCRICYQSYFIYRWLFSPIYLFHLQVVGGTSYSK